MRLTLTPPTPCSWIQLTLHLGPRHNKTMKIISLEVSVHSNGSERPPMQARLVSWEYRMKLGLQSSCRPYSSLICRWTLIWCVSTCFMWSWKTWNECINTSISHLPFSRSLSWMSCWCLPRTNHLSLSSTLHGLRSITGYRAQSSSNSTQQSRVVTSIGSKPSRSVINT